ncbi:MAG: diguanylate cyclase, partial [Actinomycetota bacterium]|nr:diguanylate cyclase [Actinomycetota bacterium]
MTDRAPRVLLADDSATVRWIARTVLEAAGYDVVEALDGAQALACARSAPVDVVVLDIEMPVMDGYEAVQALKADPATADVPVVFLTGRSAGDDLVRALDLGGHDYLRKPPDADELLARVTAAVRVKAAQDRLRSRADLLDRTSRTDVLTGLYDRRHMEEQLRAHLAAAARHGHPVSVLLVDVDRFKQVDDNLGHGAGDALLREVARRLSGQLRTEDVLGRWGGEEFLVLAPHTDLAAAGVLAERLRSSLAAAPVPVGGEAVPVTVSIGGAAAQAGQPGQERLLELADRELYA